MFYFKILFAFDLLFKVSAFEQNKNVLFIISDDLRPSLKCFEDHSAYTPNLDKLAKKSALFHQAFAQQALCSPSRNSFLTSRRPDSLHLYDFYSYWRSFAGNYTTLPQYFKQNGFHTVSYGKVFHPGISSNFTDDYPFSWSEVPWHPRTEKYKDSPVCHNEFGWFDNIVCPVNLFEQPEHTLPDIETTQQVLKFLQNWQKNTTQGFFLAVGFHKPHVPLKYPRKYLENHPLNNISLPSLTTYPPTLPTVAWNPWTDLRKRHDIKELNLTFPYQSMSDEWIKLIRQSYYAAVTYVDSLIGAIMAQLKKSGLSKNTVVIVMGDHGWSLGEHGEWAKYSNYDVAVRVPLMISVPKLTTTGTALNIHRLVELVDLFPTLVDLFNLEPLAQCNPTTDDITCTEGMSLMPLLTHGNNAAWPKLAAFSQYPRPGLTPTLHPNSDKPKLKEIKFMGYSMRTEQYRYTEFVGWNSTLLTPNWNILSAGELYDHTIDPDENLNLYDRPGLEKIQALLSGQLRKGWRNVHDSIHI